jgi:hypothetical protein
MVELHEHYFCLLFDFLSALELWLHFVTMAAAAATATWPDAAPLAGEELIFSISCGNSHLHWATHFGEAQDYNPDMFWR